MTKAYFWKTLGTFDKNKENLKLLDTDEYFAGRRSNIRQLYNNDTTSFVVNGPEQFSRAISIPVRDDFDWVRCSADISIASKEWNFWLMTQLIVRYKNKDVVVKERMIRLQRHLDDNQLKRMYLDVQKPKEPITDIELLFWNAEGQKETSISNIQIEVFDE